MNELVDGWRERESRQWWERMWEGGPFGGKGRSKGEGQARVGLNSLYYLKGVSYYYQRILVIILIF